VQVIVTTVGFRRDGRPGASPGWGHEAPRFPCPRPGYDLQLVRPV